MGPDFVKYQTLCTGTGEIGTDKVVGSLSSFVPWLVER